MHPAAKLCTPGAGCTLNFEHCVTLCLTGRKMYFSQTSLIELISRVTLSFLGAKTDDKAAPFSPKLIAIIVGSAVGLIVVIVIIIIVIVCMRKRHSGVK